MKTYLALVACVALTGCGTIRYGDGKLGSLSLRPAFDAVADAVDKQAPGRGAMIRDYYEQSQVDRVPEGYEILWTSYLDGKQIDETRIKRIPDLVAKSGSPVEVIETPADAEPVGDETEDGLRAIGGKR